VAKIRLEKVTNKYEQRSVINRLEAFFLDNVGVVIPKSLLQEVATDPITGEEPENWHQRLSELRTDRGYTILSNRDDPELKVSEYCLPSIVRRETAKSRKAVNKKIKEQLLQINPACEYPGCYLKEGDIDPIGGGTVRLQVDHKTAHNHDDNGNHELSNFQLLCGRHNVTKKNLWDDQTGKLNIRAILQFISKEEKQIAHLWLLEYFKEKK